MDEEDILISFITNGNKGDQGEKGYQGYTGFQGFTGVQGYTGFQGWQGYTGFQGFQGFTGFQGHQGLKGDPGTVQITPGIDLIANDISANDVSFNDIVFLGKIYQNDGTEFVGGAGAVNNSNQTFFEAITQQPHILQREVIKIQRQLLTLVGIMMIY